jgi:hypothetical protein
MRIAFTVDDLSPLYSFEHLDLLHEALDLKFDAFIPTNHFGKALLLHNPEWVSELKSRPWIQPNIHGVRHYREDGSQIEYEHYTYSEFIQSFTTSIGQFDDVGIKVYGVKAPGWNIDNMEDYIRAAKDVGLQYVCLHRPGEKLQSVVVSGMKTFGYTLCIHEIRDSVKGGVADVILHSHIHPSQGQNGLTEALVQHVLVHMMPYNRIIKPVFLKDCL